MLKGQTVIITGSGRGIGKGIAEVFAENGANVVISDISMEMAEKTAKELADTCKVETLALQTDVAEEKQVHDMVAQTVKRFGTVDVLVNNAGINAANRTIEDIPHELWEKMWRVNFMGQVYGIQAVTPLMKEKKKGRIVSIASMSTQRNKASIGPYGCSKMALIALVRTAAHWLGDFNITVNAIAPGLIASDMTSSLGPDLKESDIAWEVVLGQRLGTPRDVGKTALFLASDLASYITGTTLDVNGGIWMR